MFVVFISFGHKGQGTQFDVPLSFNSENYQFYAKLWLNPPMCYIVTSTLVLCIDPYDAHLFFPMT